MPETPRLNFPYIVSSNMLDALVQPTVENVFVSAPPESPVNGALYVVGNSPPATGAWAGREKCLAQYIGETWAFYVPFEGLTVWDKSTKKYWNYIDTQWCDAAYLKLNGSSEMTAPLITSLAAGAVKQYRNVAGFNGGTANMTGTMKVTLPVSWTSTMMQIVIRGYDFGYGAWELLVGGYNFQTSPCWLDCTAQVISGSPPFSQVRFAHDGSKCCILLGTTATTWQYSVVVVDTLVAGFGNAGNWDTGWAISLLSSEAGIVSIVIPSFTANVVSNVNRMRLTYGTSAPANPANGKELWIDTTNKVIKIYEGGAWIIMGSAYST